MDFHSKPNNLLYARLLMSAIAGREICWNWHSKVCSECVAHPEFPASPLSEPNQRMGVIAAGTLVSFLLIVLLSLLCCCCLCRHKDDHKWVTDGCLFTSKGSPVPSREAHPGHENIRQYFLFSCSHSYQAVKWITVYKLSLRCPYILTL